MATGNRTRANREEIGSSRSGATRDVRSNAGGATQAAGSSRYSEHRPSRGRAAQRVSVDAYSPSDAEGATGARAPKRTRSAEVTTRSARTAQRPSARARSGQQPRPAAHGAQGAARQIPVFRIGLVVVLAILLIFGVRLCSTVTPINVTVNGTEYAIRGDKNIDTAIKDSGLPINAGDLISLTGQVLEKHGGHPFAATVNGEPTTDGAYKLREGDVLTVTDGEDAVEPYDAVEEELPFSAEIRGSGSVHEFTEGANGVLEKRTGRISGETVEKQTVAPTPLACTRHNLNTGAQKVIAITFDDGPSADYTGKILDILKANDAKATFFTVGTEIQEEGGADLVKRAYDEGHEICTHTYDHALPVGGLSITTMSPEAQIAEIEDGRKAISDATGVETSRIVRLPGGNMDENTVVNIAPYVEYEIGWNVDSADWTLPGVDVIYDAFMSVKPGDIVLCHDGGGDRSQTVEALQKALPELKKKGFTFVTVSEILQYPAE